VTKAGPDVSVPPDAGTADVPEAASPRPILRALFCVQSLEGGGAERQIAYLANALARRRWDVHLAVLRFGPNWTRIDRERIRLHRLEALGNYDPRLLRGIWRVARSVRPSVVLTWLPQMDTLGGCCANLLGLPWILCERTSGRAYGRGLRELVRRQIARGASAVVANSEGGAAYWRPGRPGRPVLVVPNIVPVAEIEASAAAAPGTLRPAGGPGVIVCVGRLVEVRNHATVIEALSRVRRETAARLEVLGKGPEAGRLRSLAARLRLGDAVSFLGFVDDVYPRMRRADAFVSVSALEGHPNATIEAAVAGCPLVLSDIPEHRALFSDDEALFVPLRDPDGLAEALLATLGDPDGARARAEAARLRVRAAAEADVAEIYDQLMRGLANRAPR